MIQRVYKLFIATGIILAIISLLVKIIKPESAFDIVIYEIPIHGSFSFLWLSFSIYLFFLAGIYITAERAKLKTRKWLLVTHCVFVCLFLVFFTFLSAFDFYGFRAFLERFNMSIFTLASIYAFVTIIDIVLFLIGLIVLAINLCVFSRK